MSTESGASPSLTHMMLLFCLYNVSLLEKPQSDFRRKRTKLLSVFVRPSQIFTMDKLLSYHFQDVKQLFFFVLHDLTISHIIFSWLKMECSILRLLKVILWNSVESLVTSRDRQFIKGSSFSIRETIRIKL